MPTPVPPTQLRGRVRRGFTLVELIVAMAIIAILASIAVVQLRRGERMSHLWVAADELQGAWQEMQVRSLSGAQIPRGTPLMDVHYGMPMPAPEDYPTEAEGYGLVLFGPNHLDRYGTLLQDAMNGRFNFVDGYLFMMACAIPLRPYIQNLPYDPDFGAGISPQWDMLSGTCFSPLREFAPVMPNEVVIDPSTVEIGTSTSALVQGMVQSQPNGPWGPWIDSYETCTRDGSRDVSPVTAGAFFLAVYPPQPTMYLNGWSGCKVLQFAIQEVDHPEVRLWVRFDLNTGRVSVTPERPT